MAAAQTKVQGLIDDNAVVVFSKSWCPYCKATKALLTEQNANFKVVELDKVDDGESLHDALKGMTNQTSVPSIYIDHKHIGGNSDLQALKGDLPNILSKAGAL